MLNSIEEQVIKILSECLPKAPANLGVCSRLVEDLHMDSITLVEFVLALNEMVEIEVPAERVAEWRTVEDVCSWLSANEMPYRVV